MRKLVTLAQLPAGLKVHFRVLDLGPYYQDFLHGHEFLTLRCDVYQNGASRESLRAYEARQVRQAFSSFFLLPSIGLKSITNRLIAR